MRWLVFVALTIPTVASAEAEVEWGGKRACLQPLGNYDKKLVPIVARGIEHLYGIDVDVLETRKLPKKTYYRPRGRHKADWILEWLDDDVIGDTNCNFIIGFTGLDISTTKEPHKDWGVFGLAWLGGPVGVVSTYRLRRKVKRSTLAKRAVKVVNHELGHVFGAPHIDERPCLMMDAQGTIKSVDAEKGLLCDGSRDLIEKKHNVTLPALERFDWGEVL